METLRSKRWLTLLATMAAAAVFAVGCGDDDDGGGNGGGGLGDTQQQTDATDAPDTGDAPSNKDEAIDRCFEEADKLEGDAKEQARAACEAAETGDTEELKNEIKEQCLESAKQIPDPDARSKAEDACEKLGD